MSTFNSICTEISMVTPTLEIHSVGKIGGAETARQYFRTLGSELKMCWSDHRLE